MKLLGSIDNKITKDNGERLSHLEITEVILVHCNLVNNSYKQNSRVMYTFFLNKLFGQSLELSPKRYIYLKTLS